MIRITLLALLVGCTPTQVRGPDQSEVLVLLRLVDSFPDETQRGHSLCGEEGCILTIRRDVYPHCFVHEIRHAFEGDWHLGRSNKYCTGEGRK